MENLPTAPGARDLFVDRSDPGSVLRAVQAEPFRFRSLTYIDRPAARPDTKVVAFHYWRYGIGGAEKVTHELISLFCSFGMRVLLYTDEPEQPGDYPVPTGVIRKTVPTADKHERVAFWLDEVEHEKIDVCIYSSWLSPWAVQDCLAIQAAGASFVYYTHSVATSFFGMEDARDHLVRVQQAAYVADAIVVLNEADAVFWQSYSNHVTTVPNPVDLYMGDVTPRADPPQGKTVVFCGRLDPIDKRPDLALDVFSRVAARIPQARLSIVGGGSPEIEQSLVGQAKELGIYDSVDFHGFQGNPLPYLQSSNVLLLTSPYEGFCLSLTEAACIGLPAVIFELPHLPIVAGNAGIVQVPQGDVESAAHAVAQLLESREAQANMGRATRESYERVCKIDLEGLWKGVLADAIASHNGGNDVPQPGASPSSALVGSIVASYERELSHIEKLQGHIDRLQSELADRSQRLETLEHDLGCIVGSASFKIGRAITGLPRKVRDAIRGA